MAGSASDGPETYLQAGSAIDDRHAGLRWLAGQRALAPGDVESARAHLVAAWEYQPPTRCDRAPPSFDAWVETVGRRVGVPVLDPEGALEQAASPAGVPGGDLFMDSLHFNPRGADVVASDPAAVLVRLELLPRPEAP